MFGTSGGAAELSGQRRYGGVGRVKGKDTGGDGACVLLPQASERI